MTPTPEQVAAAAAFNNRIQQYGKHEWPKVTQELATLLATREAAVIERCAKVMKRALLAGFSLNETLNPLLDWDPRDKARRRKEWQAAEEDLAAAIRATSREGEK